MSRHFGKAAQRLLCSRADIRQCDRPRTDSCSATNNTHVRNGLLDHLIGAGEQVWREHRCIPKNY